ncbi:hypothetical protein, partial [Streptococcus oralis]|uniref:hypothetical protein n=1 Tax=Streptococcus oralis TaxID=1303 RepID=UPI001F511AAB
IEIILPVPALFYHSLSYLLFNESSYFLSIPHLLLVVKGRNAFPIAKEAKKRYNVTKSREVWNEERK